MVTHLQEQQKYTTPSQIGSEIVQLPFQNVSS